MRRNLAFALFASGHRQEAVAEYEKLVRSDPSDAELRINFGTALREAGLLGQARHELEEALQLCPDSARAHYQLGLLWITQKDKGRAMEQFHAARRLDPSLRPP